MLQQQLTMVVAITFSLSPSHPRMRHPSMHTHKSEHCASTVLLTLSTELLFVSATPKPCCPSSSSSKLEVPPTHAVQCSPPHSSSPVCGNRYKHLSWAIQFAAAVVRALPVEW